MALTFLDEFAAPGAAYRGKPFWAWNGKLEPAELRRQIRVMHRMGLGGFFMHARVGLATPYLSEEWFSCIDACLDEAKTLGMEAWLYDEDRWPSGAAGGLVTKNPAYRMRSLMMFIVQSPEDLIWDDDTLAVFSARVEGGTAREVTPITFGTTPVLTPGHVILRFAVVLQGLSSWYNGYTYLDTLSHEAVREFIAVTHEAYAQRYGEDFGRLIPGIFCDEPNYGNMLTEDNNTAEARGLPWTAKLPEIFHARYGYDLLPHLVELVFDVEGQAVTPARYHYHDCSTFLFVDAYARQIGEWCEEHHLAFTGHVLEEDTLSHQTCVAGDCMRFYEHMQAPGMDLLTEHWRAFVTAKQVTSAAHQFGRRWRLTETYGCTGWDFPFAGHKALGDWQVALGINLRAQHLSWYTMLGEAKRDYPAAIFYQSPWWESYATVEDYFARIQAVMTHGSEVRDLLVVHPIESMWLQVKAGWRGDPAVGAADDVFQQLCDTLLAGHVDFDFGDEELMSRHAKVDSELGQAVLRVGEAIYRAVLAPPMTTMRASTLELLRQFKAAGGVIVFCAGEAAYLDAVPSTAVTELARACANGVPSHGEALLQAVEGAARRLSISDGEGREIAAALYLLREDAEAYYLLICNTGEDFLAEGRSIFGDKLARERTLVFPQVVIRGLFSAGTPLLLHPETGAVTRAQAVCTEAGWEIVTELPGLGSRLFVLPKRAEDVSALPAPTVLQTVRTELLEPAAWRIQLSEQNNLLLDRPRFRLGAGEWQGSCEILRVDRAVREALGVPARGGSMVQPWMREKELNPPTVPLALSYTFQVEALPSGALSLALEAPETFRVSLNGVPVSMDAECGWWVDRSLRSVPLDPSLLRRGENELTLECAYSAEHPGLEMIYLLGQFGVRLLGNTAVMTALPASLHLGDWTEQALTFYSGAVVYQQEIQPTLAAGERLFLHVPDYRGACVRVLLDGRPAGIIAWEPNEVEISEFIKAGTQLLQIELISHRRNSHGPFHLPEKWPTWTGPGEYQPGDDRWFDGYQLVPCGLMAAPELIVRR